MAEVLSCLLAVGVVLVWLVLFHLLVNVWLLCVFTSLLVVLGGWLGSQAALESNSVVVHLERFIPLEQVEASSDDEPLLDQEIENTVKKIIRDFVSSWYTTVSTETSFQTEVQEAMVLMGLELKARARRVDHKMLTKRTLDLCGGHLQSYLKAKEAVEGPDSEEEELLLPSETPSVDEEERRHGALWRAYSSHGVPHPAVRSAATEVNYSRSVTDLLLHVLVPPPHLESRTGRLIVGELITCNVLYPLITKLSDPDWLNILLIEVFAKSKSDNQQQPEELAAGSTQQPISSSPPSPPLPPPTTLLPPALPSPSPAAQSSEPPPRQLQENKPAGLQNFQKYPDTPPSSPMTPRVEMPTPTDAAGTTVPPLDLPAVYDTVDSEDILYCPQNNNADEEEPGRTFLRRYLRPGKSNPFYQENDSDLDSPSADYKQSSTDSLLMMVQEEGVADMWKESTTPTDLEDDAYNGLAPVGHPKVLVNSEPLELACVCDSLSPPQRVEGDSVPSNLLPARELLLVGGVEHVGVGGGNANNELGVVSPLKPPSPSFSFEPLSSPEGPVIIQNLRIAGTITAKEHRGTGSHPYTLYTIKYETVVGCENPASLQQQGSEDTEESTQVGCDTTAAAALPAHPVAYHSVNTAVAGLPAHPVAYHTVNRRYSEFLNLQTRLEEKADLRKLIKGVKGPKKIFPDMPFGNMDTDKIEARKGLLETFVKQLCAIPETANSEEMQEFLALNTDARIAFVKKPFIVSRIDKIVVNAIVDTLKTAFPPRSEPQSPTEDNEDMDGGKITDKNKSKSRLRFTSKGGPFMNGSDVRPQLLFGWGQSRMVISGMSPGELEDFISEQERLLVLQDPESEREDCLSLRDVGGVCGCQKKNSLTDRENQQLGITSETALAETALDVLCLLVKRQWSWLCTQNIQRTIRLLFGTFIDKWLEVGVANLTCTQYWVSYLRMLQEAVWPGGVLPSQPRPQRSPRQKEETKQQALSSLLTLVPDLVTDMLGSDKYKLSWQTAHQSLQNPIINRHLVYCICDLLLEFLVPEMLGEDFQRSLLQGLSKSPA